MTAARGVHVSPTVRAMTSQDVRLLERFQVFVAAPDAVEEPGGLTSADVLCEGTVPGTVAGAMRAIGKWSEGDARDFDAQDYWFSCHFDAASREAGFDGRRLLRLDGLASLATVWLNGEVVATSDSMFHRHVIDVTDQLKGDNELALCFHALSPRMRKRRPRPRWKTRLVADQAMRWFRTTLLGRIPGWSPPVAAVGPWRPIAIVEQEHVSIESLSLHPTLSDVGDGLTGTGRVDVQGIVEALGAAAPTKARLKVGAHEALLQLAELGEGRWSLTGGVMLEQCAELWWPHTHGAQPRYEVGLTLEVDGRTIEASCGRVAFRSLELHEDEGCFGLRVNGVPIFCRGACWTTLDMATLGGSLQSYRQSLELARSGGMNMLRVGGTMVYEDDAFYELCDELGILVWQDFMFANMDYPADDEGFVESAKVEAADFLTRVAHRPCLAVLCGGSEVEQQAAMFGVPREHWRSSLFGATLPKVASELAPGTPYVPSSPFGGAMPFHLDRGVGHYYGVGAYLRPIEDARLSEPCFTSECLAFSNVPRDRTLYALLSQGQAPVHHPLYKERVPRDNGAGWDFADVTEHYMETLFGVQARSLRYADMDRYLELARVTPGELMERVIGLWRRPGGRCRGALIWFYRDLWRGAGWGVVDSDGLPKASFDYLRRAFAPRALFLVDEGLNGLVVQAHNDLREPLDSTLEVTFFDDAGVAVDSAKRPLRVPAHGASVVRVEDLMGRFIDSTYAYRFGPPRHTVIHARLDNPDGGTEAEAFHFPVGLARPRLVEPGLSAHARACGDGQFELTVETRAFAQAVSIEVRGFEPSDNHFHVAPRRQRRVRLSPSSGDGAAPSGRVRAINHTASVRIEVDA